MMTAEPKLFDLGFLVQMNDPQFLVQVINLYLDDAPADLATMQKALQQGTTDLLARTAHKLKSSTGMLQANRLFQLLDTTETLARSGKLNAELQDAVESAQYEFDLLRSALREHLAGL